MGSMRGVFSWAGAAAAAVLCLWGTTVASAQPGVVPAERLLYKDVSGRVVDAVSGAPVAGVPVSLLYEVTTTGSDGGFRFEKVPLTHTAEVSLRIRSSMGIIIGCTTLDVPVRFYPVTASSGDKLDVVIVDPSDDKPVELRLVARPSAQIDEYCQDCHQSNPCLETSTYEEVVRSGKDLRGLIVDEDKVDEFRRTAAVQGMRVETYRTMRYQDTHPDGMNMDVIPTLELVEYEGRFRRPESLELASGKFVTCDTCHTRHMPTQQKQYVVLEYELENTLCYQCHR